MFSSNFGILAAPYIIGPNDHVSDRLPEVSDSIIGRNDIAVVFTAYERQSEKRLLDSLAVNNVSFKSIRIAGVVVYFNFDKRLTVSNSLMGGTLFHIRPY
jgi:hypothetical protein